MDPFDELREMVQRMIEGAKDNLEVAGALIAVRMCIDDVDAAHPGLVDFTRHCDLCGRAVMDGDCLYGVQDWAHGRPLGKPYDICGQCNQERKAKHESNG